MLGLKWNVWNNEKELQQNKFQPKSVFIPRKKHAAIEIYLSSLEEKLMKFSKINAVIKSWSEFHVCRLR